jgi:hypothetical protein
VLYDDKLKEDTTVINWHPKWGIRENKEDTTVILHEEKRKCHSKKLKIWSSAP